MVVWSRLVNIIPKKFHDSLVKRTMSGHGNKMPIEVSRWQWHKFKDLLHYYVMVGVIPITAVITYVNIFIGPAKLAEIPEGYTPKHWEYYSHPITRFMAQYLMAGYQQEYEKYMHFMYEEDERAKMRLVTQDIQERMRDHHDYQAYFYRPVTTKYFQQTKEFTDELNEVLGENAD